MERRRRDAALCFALALPLPPLRSSFRLLRFSLARSTSRTPATVASLRALFVAQFAASYPTMLAGLIRPYLIQNKQSVCLLPVNKTGPSAS
jgi:hypothetical protein